MNRILIDRKINDLGTIKEDEIIITINQDCNFIINEPCFKKYVFNVLSGNINILCTLSDCKDTNFEFNIDDGNISFNQFSVNIEKQNIKANLNKTNSTIKINNSYISKKSCLMDINTYHKFSNTSSYVYNAALTKDDGSVKLNVKTYVEKKKKNCIVNQDSKILSLNDTNENEINPILLIDEYESFAKHSAFIGKFNKDEMFYLKSRGIDEKSAIKLLVNGVLIGRLDIDSLEKENLIELI